MQWCSHLLIQSFSIYLISLVAIGTSLRQNIFKVGAWSIFLTVPDVDLKTANVIICSNLILSLFTERAFMEYVSNVENADDWLRSYFSDVFWRNLLNPSNYGRGSKLANPPPFFCFPVPFPELFPVLYYSILVNALSILSFLSGS